MSILAEIETYCKCKKMAPSYFGRLAVNDGGLVQRLRGGGDVTTRNADKIRDYMKKNPPPGDQVEDGE